ncbi:MAG: PAS domain-containing protein, partial [Rhizobiales bacterium]|nr:PAS domain-containing protein [Hyphomicrobiales bacterium]
MSEDHRLAEDDAGQARRAGMAGRLAEARLFLAALAVLLAAFVVFGFVGPLPALAFLAAVLLVAGFTFREVRSEPARLALRSPPSVWPETGVKRMADALPEPFIILDRRGVVRYANRHAEAAFPIRPGDPLTFRLRAPDFVRAFERVAAGGPPERIEFVERVPTERWFLASFSLMEPHEDRRRSGFVVLIISELTEQRRSERVRVDFIANASHELRTPLA